MYLIVTIDVEEDNWGDYSPSKITVDNIKKIPELQSMFDSFEVKPTYLINYPVATDPFAITMFSQYLDQEKCEIGMHCHPWNTPPIKEAISEYNSMLCNLPESLVNQKLTYLHETICENYGIAPVSFRAGRWGFGPSVTRALSRLGYHIDSSVSPYMDWRKYNGPDFSGFGPEPFGSSLQGIEHTDRNNNLLHVPATIGFLQPNFNLCQRWIASLETPLARKLHIAGILSRLRLLNKVWLSPEVSETGDMIRLAKRMTNNNYPCLNLTFHSTSLQAGLSPFVRTVEDQSTLTKRIRDFLAFIRETGIKSCTLSEIGMNLSKTGITKIKRSFT